MKDPVHGETRHLKPLLPFPNTLYTNQDKPSSTSLMDLLALVHRGTGGSYR